MEKFKKIFTFKTAATESKVLGPENKHLKLIEEFHHLEITVRNSEVIISDNPEAEALLGCLFETLEIIVENKISLNEIDIASILNNLRLDNYEKIIKLYIKKEILMVTATGKSVYPRTFNQKLFIESLGKNDIVFAVGPAGTGKTYLAVLFAIKKLRDGDVKKIVLVRPVVEAGEKLGYLPGDMKEKVDPYLVPLYDGLNEAIGQDSVNKLIERGAIEIAPLAYMRGRTLENCIIILDEAQNSSLLQMKMFLTRLGYGSKMIITGDITQIDLPSKNHSGLIEALEICSGIPGLDVVHFTGSDVMRHPLVRKIIEKYEGKYGN
jgi:phosphate starvation-inducible PhoH-like protein